MNKTIYLIIVVATLAATTLIYFKPETHSVNEFQVKEQSSDSKIDVDLSNRHGEENQSLNDEKIAQHKIDKNLISAIEPNALRTHLIPAHFKNPEAGFLFSFNIDNMADKQVGDRIELKMLQFDLHRTAIIQSVDQLDQDIMKWRGSFEGYPEDLNYFTITQSKDDRYAILKVFTDKGSYIAEIKDGIGLAKPEDVLINDGLESH